MSAGYREIKFWPFVLALAVVSAPAIILEQAGRSRWAWAYAVLILLMLAVFYSSGLSKAAAYTARALKG